MRDKHTAVPIRTHSFHCAVQSAGLPPFEGFGAEPKFEPSPLRAPCVWALTLLYMPIAVATTPARSFGRSGTMTMFEAFATAVASIEPATRD